MASTFSDLGIELMATGENAGTWGTKTNTNLQIVEKSIAGYVEQAVTSGGTTQLTITDGDATESTSVARHAVIKLTGTITGNSIVTVPDSIEKVYIVTNGTSGAYTVQFKTASGTGITFGVSEKTTRLVYSDGTNLVDAGFGGASDMEGRELVLDADGDTTITADTDDQIDIKIAGADDFQFTANTFTAQSGSSIVVPEGGLTFGSTAITSTAAELNLLDGVSGLVQADLTKLAALDATAAELNIVDGGTSATSTTVADADRVVLNDNGTMVQVAVTDLAAYFDDEITAMPNLTSVGTLTTLTVDNVIVNGSTIGHTSDTDLLTVASGVLTVAGEVSMTTLDIGGTNVTSTAAELNILDGVTSTATELNILDGDTSATSTTVADADRVVLNDAGTMKQVAVTDLAAYFDDEITAMSNLVTTGALNSGSISSGFGNIDIGSSNLTATGTISLGAASFNDNAITNVGDIALDSISADATDINIAVSDNSATALTIKQGSDAYLIVDTANSSESVSIGTGISGTAITLGHSTSEVTVADNLTVTGDLTVSGTTTTVNSTTVNLNDHNIVLDTGNSTSAVINGAGITIEGGSGDDATFTYNTTGPKFELKLGSSHEDLQVDQLIAASLDISGNVDVDGTLETDALSINSTTVTATATEINLIDGGSSAGTTAVADADGIITNDGGTMRLTTAATFKTYFQSGISTAFDDLTTGDAAVNVATSAGNITIDAQGNDTDIIFKGTDATADITMLTLDGSDAGSATFNDKVIVGDGKLVLNSTAVTSTAAELNLLDGVSGLVQADLTKLAAVDSTAAELNIVDGGTSATSTTVADADRVVLNDNGTMVQVAVTDLAAYFDDEITAMPNLTSVGTLTTLTVDNVIINGTTIGHTDDTDLITIADGIATVAGEISVTTLDIGGTNVAATAAELNIVDGNTSATSTTLVDADRVVVNDNGTMVQVAMTDVKTYIGGGTSWQAIKTGNFTASAGQGVFANTTSSAFTVTLPSSPSLGDEVTIVDYAGTFDSNSLTVGRNSEPIQGVAEDLVVSTERASFTLVYVDGTQGWLFKND
jgi:hypothetical protein